MQPENQNHNWQPSPDSAEQAENLQMYTPAPDYEPEPAKTAGDTEQEFDFEPVHWTASEYIHSERNGLWFVVFAVVVIGLIAFDLLILKSYTFSVLIVVMTAALTIYSRRPPRNVDYTLSIDQGLYIGDRLYHFSDFKAFGLIRDGDHHSIILVPTKRFDPGISVYFPEEAGEKIVDILGARLPMENLKLDMIDIIVRKLRL